MQEFYLFIFAREWGGGEISYKQMPSKQKQNNQGENENKMADKHGRCKIRLIIILDSVVDTLLHFTITKKIRIYNMLATKTFTL